MQILALLTRSQCRVSDTHMIVKTLGPLVFFFRTTRPITTKLATNYPWVKGIKVCSNEGPALFQGEIITK